MSSAPILTHFNEKLPLKLDTDASQYGIGAVISHILSSGEERPIAYASRMLSKSERNYAQIEKEALGIIFGVKKFHHYLCGRKFLLVTDHKPLTTLLGPKSGIPTLATARSQRWALLLEERYSNSSNRTITKMGTTARRVPICSPRTNIEYRSTTKHANADFLSRLPIHSDKANEEVDEVRLITLLQSSPCQ